MEKLTRRSLLRASAGLAAAGTIARPYIANAAATTATVWWVQGFAQEEDIAFQQLVTEYQKASGNTIDYSIVPFAAMRQKDSGPDRALKSRLSHFRRICQKLRNG